MPGLVLLACGLSIGIAVGWHQPWPIVWPWVVLGVVAVASAAALRARSKWCMALLATAAAALGAARITMQHHFTAADDLAAMIGDEPVLVHVRGTALKRPELRDRTAGSLGRFDYRPPATLFPMSVDSLLDREGHATPVRGQVLVRVEGTIDSFHAGDRIEATGFLRRPNPPHNPGDFDYRQYARSLGQAGVLSIEDRELLSVSAAESGDFAAALRSWRDDLRRRAGGWVLANLPQMQASGDRQRDAFLAAMLLGERDPDLDGIDQSFQRVGLAHLLAISGLNLAILAGFVLMLVRLGGSWRRWHGWLVIGVVVLYVLLIEVRTPVLRAAVMSIAAGLGVVMGRRISAAGLVALAAIAILLWRPDQLFNAGFQLTFGVVFGLIYLAPVLRRRLFGQPDQLAASTARMMGQWLMTATAVSIAAWAVATPIQVYHFGTLSPLGVPLTLLAVPLVTALLVLGYSKMILAAVLPSAAMLIGWPLTLTAEAMMRLVRIGEAIPGSVVHVPFASTTWALSAEALLVGWVFHQTRRQRRLLAALTSALILWLIWPLIPIGRPVLRIDMLSVNDGSCYLLRSGGASIVFDAGASPDLNAGRKSIVPAMRRLGVRSIDAIIISHANLDHYSSVLELIEAFGPTELLLTEQFMRQPEDDPHGPAAALMAGLKESGAIVTPTNAGAARRFGGMSVTWLHPSSESRLERVNDESAVILVEAAGRRVLMCGDIQRRGLETMLAAHPELQADVVELPHHGAFTDASAAFVKRVQPQVAMQSTGVRRLRNDRWPEALRGAQRLVTARHGACWIRIERDGSIATGRFLDGDDATLIPDVPETGDP